MATENIAGPRMPANFSNTAKKPKNSPDRWRGTMLAKSERLSACTPPCTIPTSTASRMKSRSDRMKYPSTLIPR